MKVGILTYHRSHNYGALLQAIALRYQLVKMGHEAYFIDYWPKYHQQMYAVFSIKWAMLSGLKKGTKYVCDCIRYHKKKKQRVKRAFAFIAQYIEPYCKSYQSMEHYDVIIYGSDQIWRKQDGLNHCFNPVYFGDNILQADKHVSYAASMGKISINEKDKKALTNWLSKFHKISVRESDLQETLTKLGIQSEVVLDPTILLSNEEWDILLPQKNVSKEKYIVYYRLQKNVFDEHAIQRFADIRGCKFIIIDGSVSSSQPNVISTINATDFLSLIRNAEYVFTSSYHGLIFSLIFKKQFFASFRSNAGRAKTILENLGLMDRMVPAGVQNFDNHQEINYQDIGEKLAILKISSLSFLNVF